MKEYMKQMTEEYFTKLQQGLEFQDKIVMELWNRGISFASFNSLKFQNKGENSAGIEIKFDNRMDDTGNIYIETHERSSDAGKFVFSGVNRDDNSFLWIIGNYKHVFLFLKGQLKLMNVSNKYPRVETKTSKGFLLPMDVAKKYSVEWIFAEEEKKDE